MLERLEHERRDSARRALAAQEDERRRIARELHDEVGQTLTGVCCSSRHAPRQARPAEPSRARASCSERARQRSRRCARIARGLRPEALDDLGLASALPALASAFAEQAGLRVDARGSSAELPRWPPEARARDLPRRAGGADERRAPRGRDAAELELDASAARASCCASATTAVGSPDASRRRSASAGCASARCWSAAGW